MKQLTEPSATDLQKLVYNHNLGGKLKQQETYDLPPGASWAVVGTLVDEALTPDDVPTLQKAIQSLAAVQAAEPLCWGRQPIVEAEACVAMLHISAVLSQTIATGTDKTFADKRSLHTFRVLPSAKKWIVWALKVPVPITRANIPMLKTALEDVPGIALAEHLFDGQVDTRAVGSNPLRVVCHARIDPVKEDEPEEPLDVGK